MNIVLIVRCWNRPEYLKATLTSLLKSDIDKCSRRIIYDDGSTDEETKKILNDPEFVNIPNKNFEVVFGKHSGCNRSYLAALDKVGPCDYICTVDNDVEVVTDFISKCVQIYEEAYLEFNTRDMLLTGFNPTNAHKNCIRKYKSFYTKVSCGGVHYFFHNEFKPFIYSHWSRSLDWGVCKTMHAKKLPLICTNIGILQHIGQKGLYSNPKGYNRDDKFVSC